MNKNNLILIVIIAILLLVIISGILLYVFVLSKANLPQEHPREIDKNVIVHTFKDPFINNVKNADSSFCKISVSVEIDKSLEPVLAEVEPEVRDAVNLLMRSKTKEELVGKEGQEKVKQEILTIIREIMHTKQKVTNVYLNEFIVQ